jgi:PAS domain S-box-containing protein
VIGVCFLILVIAFFSIFFPSMLNMITGAENIVLDLLSVIIEENLKDEKDYMRRITSSFGDWSESVVFVQGNNPNFIKDNFPRTPVSKEYEFNYFAFTSVGGAPVYEEFFDYLRDDVLPEPVEFDSILEGLYVKMLETYHGSGGHLRDAVVDEVVFIEGGAVFFCAAPAAVYYEDSLPSGMLVTGISLSNEYLRKISHVPTADFEVLNEQDSAGLEPYKVERLSSHIFTVNLPLEKFGGKPLMLKVSRERLNAAAGRRVVTVTAIYLLLAIAVIYLILSLSFNHFTLGPIIRLNRDVARRKGNELLDVEAFRTRGEIYSLGLAINKMLNHLTDREAAEAMLVRRIDQQELMRDLSELFVSDVNIDVRILRALEMVGRFLAVSRVVMSRFDYENRVVDYPYVWRSDEAAASGVPGEVPSSPLDEDAIWYSAFFHRQSEYITEDDTSRPGQPVIRSDLSVRAFVLVPIHVAGLYWGLLNIDQCDKARQWSESDLQLISLIQHELSNDIAKGIIQDNLTRMSQIVENTPRLAVFMNDRKKIEYINPAVIDAFGFSEDEFKAKGLGIIVDPKDLDLVRKKFFGEAEEKGKVSFDMNVTGKDGKQRILSVNLFTVVKESRSVGFGITATDITELVTMHRELIAAREQADKAREQAEFYSRAKSSFISRMSHEMRTPMNAIMSMSAFARNAEDADRRLYCLDRIDSSSRELLDIINNMLDMVKLESGGFALAPAEFDLQALLSLVCEMFRLRAGEKKQRFIADIPKDLPRRVISDSDRLKQLLINLLSNAVKFTPDGGSVDLSVNIVDSAGKTALNINVKDTGIGICPGQVERLWDAFEQGDNSTSRQHGGVGLGLTITKAIVDAMGGVISVDSTPGEGSVFTCSLPLELPETGSYQLPAKTAAPESAASAAAAPFAGRRILIADDVEVNREILFALLEDTGAEMDGVEDGEKAAAKFTERGGAYDMILMDLHMPAVDGYEASRRIRASGLPGAETVPIIAVTADTGGEVAAKCLEAGMNAHVGKPVEFTQLKEIMERLMGKP